MPQLLDEFALAEGGTAAELGKVVQACFQMRSSHINRILITTRSDLHPAIKLVHDVQSEGQRRGMPLRLVVAMPEFLNRLFDNSDDSGTVPILLSPSLTHA